VICQHSWDRRTLRGERCLDLDAGRRPGCRARSVAGRRRRRRPGIEG